MDNAQIIRRAHALLHVIPNVGFTQSTFVELGKAMQSQAGFAQLSLPLKGTLLILTRDFCEAMQSIDVEEMLNASTVEEREAGVEVTPVLVEQTRPTAMDDAAMESARRMAAEESDGPPIKERSSDPTPIVPDSISP